MGVVRTLLKKELTDSLRDRRTLAMMLLVPLLLYPGMLMLIGGIVAAGKDRLAREELVVAATSEDALRFLQAGPSAPHTTYQRLDRPQAEVALREKKLGAIVEALPGSFERVRTGDQAVVTVIYTKRYDEYESWSNDPIRNKFEFIEYEHFAFDSRL